MTLRLVRSIVVLTALITGLTSAPATAHNYGAYVFNYAGFAQNPEKLSPMPPASDAEVDRLLRQLASGDYRIRSAAAGALGQTGSPRAVEPLIAVLDEPELTTITAVSLGILKDKRAIEPLKAVFRRKDDREMAGLDRYHAAIALEMLGAPLISTYMLLDPEASASPEQNAITDALIAGDRTRAVRLLLESLETGGYQDDERYQVLYEITDPSCAAVLRDSLHTGSEPARCIAACLLTGMDSTRAADALIPIVSDRSSKCRERAIDCLASTGDPRAVDVLTALLKDTSKEIRLEALHALGQSTDPKALAVLQSIMKNRKDPLWESAVFDLAEREDVSTLDLLIPVLQARPLYVACAAARALGEIGDRRAVEPLIAALSRKDDPQGELKSEAAGALSRLGDPRAVQPIVAAFAKDPGEVVRCLSEIKHASSAKALFGLLRSAKTPPSALRDSVVVALSSIGDPAVEPSVAALKDANLTVRAAAIGVLAKLKDPRSIPGLISALGDKSADVRSDAVLALGNQGNKQAAPKVRAALKDASARVRANSALSLGVLLDVGSVQALTQAMQDKVPEVRAYAGLALCELGDARGLPYALRIVKGEVTTKPVPEDVLARAIRACGRVKGKRAIGPIIDLMAGYLAGINMSVFDGAPNQDLISAPVEALASISGQDFGHAYYRWFAWSLAEGHTKPPLQEKDASEEEW